jgi:membrane-associated phospholipid phosphatase
MKGFFKNNSVPLVLYFLFITISLYTIIFMNRDDLHVQINLLVGNPLVDKFFHYITFLGDGWIAGFVILPAFFLYNTRLGIYVTISFIVAALITNALKWGFFQESYRPYWIYQYQNPYNVRKVEGEHLNIIRSFPSGHATQAFAIFFGAALASIKNYSKFFFLLIAIITACSRVYLCQHWIKDVAAGSAIGVLSSLTFYFLFYNKQTLMKLDKPLLQLFKK